MSSIVYSFHWVGISRNENKRERSPSTTVSESANLTDDSIENADIPKLQRSSASEIKSQSSQTNI